MHPLFALSSEYPFWLTPICILFGAGISYFLYRNRSDIDKRLRLLLIFIRSVYITFLAFLLISPFLLLRHPIIEKPILIYAQDVSESLRNLTDSSGLGKYFADRSEFLDKCRGRFEIHELAFGEKVTDFKEGMPLDHGLTDFSDLLREVESRFENRNVASMLLASDGLYNRGENPMYSQAVLPYPLYTVAVGDTAMRKDAWIDKILHNKLAFFGNTFEARVTMGALMLKNQKSEISIRRGSKVYTSRAFTVNSEDFTATFDFTLPADETGLLRFETVVKEADGEVSAVNNRKYFYVEVLEGQQNILIIAAVPHPDVAALKAAINGSRQFRAVSMLAGVVTGKAEDYDLMIFQQLPSLGNYPAADPFLKSGQPRLFVMGTAFSADELNKMGTGLNLSRFKGRFNEAKAEFNRAFTHFSAGDGGFEAFSDFPPLISPFCGYENDGRLNILFHQKIGKVATAFPLLAFSEKNGRRTGLFCGEGLWRWRLYNYSRKGSNAEFDELIQKIVQYLCLREDRSRFRVEAEPSYFERSDVVIHAEYYDQTFTLRNEAPAEFFLLNERGQSLAYQFLKSDNSYTLNLGKLQPGEYKWKARLKDGPTVFEKSGTFSVKILQLESSLLRADHRLLFNLGDRYGGGMVYPDALDELADRLLEDEKLKPVIHYNETLKELINFKWIFFAILILITVEWALRKYHGLT